MPRMLLKNDVMTEIAYGQRVLCVEVDDELGGNVYEAGKLQAAAVHDLLMSEKTIFIEV